MELSRRNMGVSLNGGTPNLHPKMISFSRKTPWLLGTTILGNPHICAEIAGNALFLWHQKRCEDAVTIEEVAINNQDPGPLVVSTHLKNMLVKLDHFPRVRGENKKCLKPPAGE